MTKAILYQPNMTTDLKQDSKEQLKTLGYQFSAEMKFIIIMCPIQMNEDWSV